MNEIHYLNKALAKVIDKLNSYSLNYVAEVGLYPVPGVESDSLEENIKSAFGSEAILGGTLVSSNSELLEELLTGLSYAGDSGAYANKKYIGSTEHRRDLENIKNKLKPLLSSSTNVTSFWLKEGHPFYPVFWDFAFLVENGVSKFILIGSSSD